MSDMQVVSSSGVLITDRSWLEVVEKLYYTSTKDSRTLTTLCCDIVTSLEEIQWYWSDGSTLLRLLESYDAQKYGLCFMPQWRSIPECILPHTMGIDTLAQAAYYLKQRIVAAYPNEPVKIDIYAIQTDRKVVSLVN